MFLSQFNCLLVSHRHKL